MLCIVRHGRTAANAAGLLLGRADPPLDELGRRQAASVAAALGQPVRVISSPLQRAQQTADAFGVAVETDERWIELDYGDFDGRPASEVPAEVWAEWRSDPDFAPPGGESLRSLRARVEAACDDLLVASAGDPDALVVVVTHVSPVKAAVGWALDLDERVNWRTFVAPGSVTRIGGGPGGAVLRSFNEVAHLDG